MKKIFFAAFAGLLICTSCTSDNKDTEDDKIKAEEQKNLAASDVIMKAFETGNTAGIDSVVSTDFIDHTDRGDMKGRDSMKAMVKFVHANFTDMKAEKLREVADGEYVFTWVRYTGNSNGSPGMPKGPYSMSSVELGKYKDGMAVEHWSFLDMQDMMKMMPHADMTGMDNMDKPGKENKMDTGKNK